MTSEAPERDAVFRSKTRRLKLGIAIGLVLVAAEVELALGPAEPEVLAGPHPPRDATSSEAASSEATSDVRPTRDTRARGGDPITTAP